MLAAEDCHKAQAGSMNAQLQFDASGLTLVHGNEGRERQLSQPQSPAQQMFMSTCLIAIKSA